MSGQSKQAGSAEPASTECCKDTLRLVAHAPRTQALVNRLSTMRDTCIGCEECNGVCRDLVDTVCLPELVLKEDDT